MKTILPFVFILAFNLNLLAQTTYEITWITNITVQDASLTIEEGDAIKWIWGEDAMPHDVSSVDPNAPQGFGSTIMSDIGSTYEFTFTDAVIFDYHCSVHPQQMTGTITVEPTMSVADKFLKNLKYYPNPVRDRLVVTSLLPVSNYEVYTLHGKQLFAEATEAQNLLQLNLEWLTPGVYFVKVYAENQSGVIKVIKN